MKKFISVLLSLLMMFSLCLSVSADDGRITTRDELQSALDNGGTVSLTDDVDASANGLTVKKDVTLDLNGHSLKVANSNATNIQIIGATLTLVDSTDNNKDGKDKARFILKFLMPKEHTKQSQSVLTEEHISLWKAV